MLRIGDKAPDFDLPALIGGVKQRFRLSEQVGKNVVLAFYPFNWDAETAVQFTEYQAARRDLLACGAEIVGICVESIMNTTAWERAVGPFDFPLCSDFWPHGEVSAVYGLLRSDEPAKGASQRAVYIIDKSGTLVFSRMYKFNDVPDAQEIFTCVRGLRAA